MENSNNLELVDYNTRVDILNINVAAMVKAGWVLESINGCQAILFKPRKIGFFWNFIFTLLTGGLWGIVWLWRILVNKGRRAILTIDQYGQVVTP